jgi:hypothetical protein
MAGQRDTENQSSGSKVMNSCQQTARDWLAHRAFGGLDWASQKHNVIVVDPRGKVVEDFEIAHSALGWKNFRERMASYGAIHFGIETKTL